ncbi:MAG: hypothetical protein J0L77_01800 [Alphaproteobacteria bacterium]|nr:hypothetical protein [Alphaproteobacteria bacterium]
MPELTELERIKVRNNRVEADKAWETSWTRRLCIATFTYGLAAFYMQVSGLGNPWTGACVPAGGYLLSTMSLRFIKKIWLKEIYDR